MAVLRYIGQLTQTFKDVVRMPTRENPSAPPLVARVGELKPGQEFSVPDELAESYIHRSDIEVIVPPVAPAQDEPEAAAPADAVAGSGDQDPPADAAETADAPAPEDVQPGAAAPARARRGKAA